MQEDYPLVGVPEIDRDHEALAADLRRLIAAVKDDDSAAALPLGETLIERARVHFALEERLMREIGFAFAARHKGAHDAFLDQGFSRIEDLRKSGLTAPGLRWIAETMGWFGSHVLTEDNALAKALAGPREAR